MKIKKMNQPLSYKLLCFIASVQTKRKIAFSFLSAQSVLEKVYGKSYKFSTLHKEFSNLKKQGLIEYLTHYRKKYPGLTVQGRLAIKTPLSFKHYDTWDGKWRLVTFKISGNERDSRLKLMQYLESLGFARLQDSVYIFPYSLLNAVNRFATDLGIRQYVKLMVVENLLDEERTILNAWKIEDINLQYKEFIADVNKNINRKENWLLIAKKLELDFAKIYQNDPHLPVELLPKNWLGEQAYQKFKELSNSY